MADGYEYEYILYGNPIASKDDLQSAMYGISVSSKVPTMRCMEIITLMNTNKKFKNAFTYGVEKVHYIYNDNGEIERLNNDYVINTDYTGNQFVADISKGDSPNKWAIAQEHNLNVVNSVFLNFYFDMTKLSPAVEESIPEINELSEKYSRLLMGGSIPAEYEDAAEYITEVVLPEFNAAGWAELFAAIREQTNPPSD